jgi:hypothetical protein
MMKAGTTTSKIIKRRIIAMTIVDNPLTVEPPPMKVWPL